MELKFKKYQEGGAVVPADDATAAPADQAQAAPQEGTEGAQQDPMAQLLQAAAAAVQGQDCQTALQVCQVLVQLAQQGAGGAPEESPADEGEPVYRAGGKLVRRIKK